MHNIVIDCAGIAGPGWDALLRQTPLPGLSRFLRLAGSAQPEPLREDAEAAWLGPAERWLALALGQGDAAQTMAWGALAALGRGIDPGAQPWALALPAQLLLGRESLHLADPADLQLQVDESGQLLQAVLPLLQESGWRVEADDPRCWLLSHPDLAGVPSADPQRAIARNVGSWMPGGAAARNWRRLLTEIQMVWQYHPVNEARAAAGRPQANTLWLHGCGVLPQQLNNPFLIDPAPDHASAWWRAAASGLVRLPASRHPHRLRVLQPRASRAADPAQQQQALQQLDAEAATAIGQALQQHDAVQLVVAGEQRWVAAELRRSRRWQFWRRADAAVLLARV